MVHVTAAGLLAAAFGLSPAVRAWAVDLSLVDISTRIEWCGDQLRSCTTLCGFNNDTINGCDHQSLQYSCQCSWGLMPDMKNYTMTVDDHLCEKSFQLCYNAAANELGRQKCADDIKSQCATQPPTPLNAVVISPTSTSPPSSSVPLATSWLNPGGLLTQSTHHMSPTPMPDNVAESVVSKATLGPLIAGVVVGALVFIIAVAGLFYWLGSRRRRHDKPRRLPDSSAPSRPGASESTILSDPFTDHTIVDELHSTQLSSTENAVEGDKQDPADSHKTLISEKVNGHDMVRDLSGATALDDEMYFDTNKYRMPPPTKDT